MTLDNILDQIDADKLYIPFGVNSDMAKLQLKRAELLNINIIEQHQLQLLHVYPQ